MQEKHSGHRKRLKDKIQKFGFESLYSHEMLEFILFASIPRRNTNDLAHNLILKCGSYGEVFTAPNEVLQSVEGVGPASVLQIKSYLSHAERIMGDDTPKRIRNLGEARKFFAEYFQKKKHEEFHIVLLDKFGEPMVHDIYTDKRDDGVIVPVGEVMQTISACNPNFVLFAHNHPSGNANPSEKDTAFTRGIWKKLEEFLGITTCEHLIFANGECYSFRHNGMLQSDNNS
ncbi:MAG: JAB domain-containing protein [Bacillota bacterium]